MIVDSLLWLGVGLFVLIAVGCIVWGGIVRPLWAILRAASNNED